MTATRAGAKNESVDSRSARAAYLPDPLFEMGLSGAAGFVMVGRGVHLEHAARIQIGLLGPLPFQTTPIRLDREEMG